MTKISYSNALNKCLEMKNKYGNDIFLELSQGKAYIVYSTLTVHKRLFEIYADNQNSLKKMTIDFDESNINFIICN